MLIKHLFSSGRRLTLGSRRSCHTQNTSPNEVFKECFGFTTSQAFQFVKRNKLENKTADQILDVLKCCRSLGFTDEDIITEPYIFRVRNTLIDQRYLIMEEGGFKDITPYLIWKYRWAYNKSVHELKANDLIDPSTNVADNFIKYLYPRPKDLQVSSSDKDVWSLVHRKVTTAFLKWRLAASDEDVERLLRIHKVISYKCMRYLCANIHLALDLGFTARKILKCGYILQSYPKHTKAILTDLGNLAGADMRVEMRRYPKLMNVSPKSIIKIYGILKEYNIPDEHIRKHMSVFCLSPDTVRMRLEEIKRTPDLSVLLTNEKVLMLVVHHTRSKSRLSYLQKLQMKCTDRITLSNGDDQFDMHIKEGKDINSMRDVTSFLKNLFHKDVTHIRKRWRKHPFCLQVPLVNMEETYNCLKDSRFHTEAIYRVMHILLYPKEKVANALKAITGYAVMKGNFLSQVQKLNLVLYHIEKDHHFTGNGIWRDPVVPDVSESKTAE